MYHKSVFYAILSFLICIIVILCICIWSPIPAHATDPDYPIWTNKMIACHEAAEALRAAGYSDDCEIIQLLSEAWKSEYHDLCIVAKVIEGEAGGCEYDQMVYTGATIINRKNSPLFPNTVEEVVAAPGQYSTLYLKNFHTIQPRIWLAAKDVLDGNHDVPDDMYWEALFPQGREVWKVIHYSSRWYSSTTYFCRGTIYD